MTPLNNNEKPIGVKKITPKRKNYLVEFSNGTEITLSEDLMVEFRISLDKRFNDEEIEVIKKQAELSTYFNKTLSYISYKLRTTKEIKDYLKKLEVDEKNQLLIINKLIQYHYLDDLAYAVNFKEDCLNKNRGKKYFQNVLKTKGVSDEIINKVLISFDESILLEKLMIKYQKIVNNKTNLPIIIQKQKVKEQMLRNGLSYDLINKVIDNLQFSEDLSESFEKDYQKITSKTNDKNKIITYLMSKGFNYKMIKERMENNNG